MRAFVIAAAAAGLGASLATASSGPPPVSGADKAAICGKRSTCAITRLRDAGRDEHGGALVIAEVHFGIKDRPGDAPDGGCDSFAGEKGNGGTEYWLASSRPPLKVLALCNDGYGAADVGEDEVSVGANRLIHRQSGGSNWRWDVTTVLSLSPFRELKETGCSYFDGDGSQAVVTESDRVRFRAVAVAKDRRAQWADDDTGCPSVPQKMFDQPLPRPAPKLVSAYNIVAPGPEAANGTSGSLMLDTLPKGDALGTCAMRFATDGTGSFVVFGKPAGAGRAAEVRAVVLASQTLVIQVFDPAPAGAPAGKTWIAGSHVEIWTPKDATAPAARGNLDQIAVDLDGTVHKGVGDAPPVDVKHWQARDEKGRSVGVIELRWKDNYTLPLGLAVAYSQAEGGRQARLASTTGMEHGLPIFLPETASFDTRCGVHGGRLDAVEGPPSASTE